MSIPLRILDNEDTPNGDISVYQIDCVLGMYTSCCLASPVYSDPESKWICRTCDKVLRAQPKSEFQTATELRNDSYGSSGLRNVYIRMWIETWTGVPFNCLVLDIKW